MDLQWRRAWMRKWIEVGLQEGLTYREVAAEAGVSARTVARWTKMFEEEQLSGGAPPRQMIEPPEEPRALCGEEPEGEASFIEPEDPDPEPASQILIELSKDRRIAVRGEFDVEIVVRLIAAVEGC